MADNAETTPSAGASIGGSVDTGGGRVTGRDETRYGGSQRAGDINVTGGGGGGENWIWRMMEMAQQIRELTRDMDNLPARVTRLEQMEVVVRPAVPEIVFRPPSHAQPESINLSVRMVFTILIVALVFVIAMVGLLIYLRLANG